MGFAFRELSGASYKVRPFGASQGSQDACWRWLLIALEDTSCDTNDGGAGDKRLDTTHHFVGATHHHARG